MSVTKRLYLDHAATTPMAAAAVAAVARGHALWANPSSPHAEGRAARAALEEARGQIASKLGWRYELIFTSGASEAIAQVMTDAPHTALLVGANSHDAVLRRAGQAISLPVAATGALSVDALVGRLGALGRPGALVAVATANSETGVLNPVDAIIGVARKADARVFADASQTAGKLPLPDADFIAFSAHKFGGPPGIGALLVRDFALLAPTGGQERGYRPGTENLPGALGMAAALDQPTGWLDRAADLRRHLDGAIEAAGGTVIAGSSARIPTVGAYRMPGVAAAAQLIQFDLSGIAVSAGSACASGSLKPSATLIAVAGEAAARESIRVSLGPGTTRADVYRFIEAWRRIADTARVRAA